MKFCPSPPKSCFTIRMPNTLPNAPIHHGADAGILSPSSKPVTTALKSLIVTFLCINFSYMYSVRTADMVVLSSMTRAGSPKFHTPKAEAGSSAMVTISMILPVVTLERMCGEDDTFNLFSLTFVHLFLCSLLFIFSSCGLPSQSFSLSQLLVSTDVLQDIRNCKNHIPYIPGLHAK